MALLKASYSSIWKIAYPIIAGSFAQSIISVTDTAFMGRISSVSQAAIGLISVYYLILFMIGFSYTKGTQILVARRQGQKHNAEVGKIADNSLLVMTIFAIALFGILYFFSFDILTAIIKDTSVRNASLEFLNIRSFGLLFGFWGALFLSFYMGMGNTKIILVAIITMSGLNVLLNYLLIFGKWGFPAMEIQGAAWASNIAEVVGASIFIAHAFFSKYYQTYQLFRFKISSAIIKQITSLSLPIVMQTTVGLMAWMVFFLVVEKLGAQALAISSVVKSIYTLFGIPAWGFASSANTIVSNLMGQNQPAEVSKAIKRIVVFSLGITALLTLPLLLFPADFLQFYTVDQEVVRQGIPIVYICVLALFIYAASTILFNGIVSTGTSKVSLLIEIIAVFFYLFYIFSVFQIENVSLSTIWSAELFYWLVIGMVSFLYLKTGRWKTKEL